MKIIMLAGAGSVGKTSALEEIERLTTQSAAVDEVSKLATARDLSVAVHKSTTRKSYASAGLVREKDALDDVAFNMRFQNEVMGDYCTSLHDAVKEASLRGVDLFVADRSPYDYAGYYLSVFQAALTLEMIQEKRARADAALMDTLIWCDELQLTFLPYPGWWSTDTESSDGWRADKTGKNFIWSAVVESELQAAKYRMSGTKKSAGELIIHDRCIYIEKGNVHTRATSLLEAAFPSE